MINYVKMLLVDEGIKYRVYLDTAGKHTVGIGFNMDSSSARAIWIHADIVESFNLVYENRQAMSTKDIGNLLNTCVSFCKQDLLSIFPDFSTYPDYVQLALINLMFNMGKTVFSEFHTFIQLIKDKNYDGSANDLLSTHWASELPNRAKRLTALLKGDDSLYTSFSTPSLSGSD